MADLVIAGGGPQALTLCALLLQKRPRWRRHLRVLDPSGRWLHRWQSQLDACGITTLRSPAPHHPHPNPGALRAFAHQQRRSHELEGPYGLPATVLFSAFCAQVVEAFDLQGQVEAASLVDVELPQGSRQPLQLQLSDGRQLPARRLVVATGPGPALLPEWVERIPPGHPAAALQHSSGIDLTALPSLQGVRILIVGGGLTSGHLALGALARGASVLLLCRRQLREQPFDADPGWFGPNRLTPFRAEPCWRERQRQVLAARNGGSLTPQLAARLRQAMRAGQLQLQQHGEVAAARWLGHHWLVRCQGGQHHRVDRLWLATGHRQGVSTHPLLQRLQRQRPIACLDDWPVLPHDLRWPGTRIHVMGGLSALQLGPGARNLFGGREAAARIVAALRQDR